MRSRVDAGASPPPDMTVSRKGLPHPDNVSLDAVAEILDFVHDLAQEEGAVGERARAILARITDHGPEQPDAGVLAPQREIGDTFLTHEASALIWTDQGCWADNKDTARAGVVLAHDATGWPLRGGRRVAGTLLPVQGEPVSWDGANDS